MFKFMKKIFLFVIFLILAIGFYFVFNFLIVQNQNPKKSTIPEINKEQPTKPGIVVGLPLRLIIPSIEVDAAIQYVGLDSSGAIGSPKGAYDVAWYEAGPRPGEKGSAIITGHYGQWKSGNGSVFDNLGKLKKGDEVYVRDDKGNLISFTVQSIHTYNLNDSVPELFNDYSSFSLNLITCDGDWVPDKKTYTKRLVVFATES
jgi:LPXTG-site transpeptidase (sortase) family protein